MNQSREYAKLDVLYEKLRVYTDYFASYSAGLKLPIRSITINHKDYYKLREIMDELAITQHLLLGYPLPDYDSRTIQFILPYGCVQILCQPLPEDID